MTNQLFDDDGDFLSSDTKPEEEPSVTLLTLQNQELLEELNVTKKRLARMEENRNEYKAKYFQFKGIFQRQTQTFYEYQGLSAQSLEALSGIFKGSSFEEFLACGVQPANIDALWEFARNEALHGNRKDIPILEKIITYFVNLYNGTNDSDILGFEEVHTGDLFDVDFHIRTKESKAAGNITNVLLGGLINAFTGEVIKKAVVEID